MQSLHITNKHIRDDNVTLDEKKHIYHIKNSNSCNPTSVTTLVHSAFPEFDPDFTIDNIFASDKFESGEHKYSGMTRVEIKNSWKKAGDESRKLGIKLHAMIEDSLNGKDNFEPTPDMIQYLAFMQIPQMQSLKPFRTEWKIYSDTWCIAGMIDAVFQNTAGNYEIYDWKRVKEIKRNGFNRYAIHPNLRIFEIPDSNFYKYSLQLSIYWLILQREYNMNVEKIWLVRFDNDEYEVIPAMDMRVQAEALLSSKKY